MAKRIVMRDTKGTVIGTVKIKLTSWPDSTWYTALKIEYLNHRQKVRTYYKVIERFYRCEVTGAQRSTGSMAGMIYYTADVIEI